MSFCVSVVILCLFVVMLSLLWSFNLFVVLRSLVAVGLNLFMVVLFLCGL